MANNELVIYKQLQIIRWHIQPKDNYLPNEEMKQFNFQEFILKVLIWQVAQRDSTKTREISLNHFIYKTNEEEKRGLFKFKSDIDIFLNRYMEYNLLNTEKSQHLVFDENFYNILKEFAYKVEIHSLTCNEHFLKLFLKLREFSIICSKDLSSQIELVLNRYMAVNKEEHITIIEEEETENTIEEKKYSILNDSSSGRACNVCGLEEWCGSSCHNDPT